MRRILCLHGYSVVAQNEENWVLEDMAHNPAAREKRERIVILPKLGDLLGVDVMMQTLIDTRLDLLSYFTFHEQVVKNLDLIPPPQELMN